MPRSTIGAADDTSRRTASPLTSILLGAEDVDLEFVVGVLKNPLGLSADHVMNEALETHYRERSTVSKQALAELLDREIRYAASSDLAYLLRWMQRDDAGVRADELLADVAAKLNVKLRIIGSFETKLQRLVRAVVEKELVRMTPAQQRDLVATQAIGFSRLRQFVKHLKQKGPVGGVPILIRLAGREAAEKIATALVIQVITIVLGRQAAAQLIRSLAVRFPWWAEWIGPAAWAVTSAWIAVDVLGPAYRKTIPITLYLGLITLRDGAKDNDFFYSD
jgi:uncharacterized protein YaaW (UPF0174 family)